jgi:hypothetical protein
MTTNLPRCFGGDISLLGRKLGGIVSSPLHKSLAPGCYFAERQTSYLWYNGTLVDITAIPNPAMMRPVNTIPKACGRTAPACNA